jgi:uncharacterized protein YneF (UPF0154 family)
MQPAGGQDTQRDRKIADYMAQGLPWDVATRLTDGHLRVEQTDSGYVRIIDNVTGEVREVQIGRAGQPVDGSGGASQPQSDSDAPSRTLWDAATSGTGPGSSVRAGASIVSGMAGGPVAGETLQSRQQLRLASRGLVRSLVNNPRFPVAEVKMVLEEAGTKPSAIDNPAAMRERMIALDEFLTDQMNTAEADAGDPQLDPQMRRDQRSNAANIRAFLQQLGVPRDRAPPGVPPELWSVMTPEEKSAWQK